MRKLIFLLIVFALIIVSKSRTVATEEKTQYPLKINVFAVVSDNIEAEFKNAADLLYEEEEIETFPKSGMQVHCTLYMTGYPHDAKDEIIEKVKELAAKTIQVPITTSGLEITAGNWFFLNLTRTRDLQTLSDTVLSILSPLRAKSDFVPEWAKSFPSKLDNIKLYGSPNVLGEFSPHLTFLASADRTQLENFSKRHTDSSFAQQIEGKVIAIGIGEADAAGQIEAPWHIFPLQEQTEPETK